MKVIKAVLEDDGKLVSTFADGEWQKEYIPGVETKPDVGYLFAYSIKDLKRARGEMRDGTQFWQAEAEVAGRLYRSEFYVTSQLWFGFWQNHKLRLRRAYADYLLCSSITLTKRIE